MSIQAIQNAVVRPPVDLPSVQGQAPVSPESKESPARSAAPACDRYTPGDPAERQPIGLYELVPDEEDRPTLRFDAPEDKAEQCTTNTDRVDWELEQLREKREELEQQLRGAGSPEQAERLNKQLAQVENELRQKDNDSYRRQQAVVT